MYISLIFYQLSLFRSLIAFYSLLDNLSLCTAHCSYPTLRNTAEPLLVIFDSFLGIDTLHISKYQFLYKQSAYLSDFPHSYTQTILFPVIV